MTGRIINHIGNDIESAYADMARSSDPNEAAMGRLLEQIMPVYMR